MYDIHNKEFNIYKQINMYCIVSKNIGLYDIPGGYGLLSLCISTRYWGNSNDSNSASPRSENMIVLFTIKTTL